MLGSCVHLVFGACFITIATLMKASMFLVGCSEVEHSSILSPGLCSDHPVETSSTVS